MHWHLNVHLMESLNQVFTLYQSISVVINLYKHSFQWLDMFKFDIESSNALLNLEFLTFIKFTFAKVINDIFVLHITIKINCSWSSWHLYSVYISLCMLIMPHQWMIFWPITIPCMDICSYCWFFFSSYNVV